MHWNEKIDSIKKKYSSDDFFVPSINRKDILRNIETKFINRPDNYYDLNNSNNRFSNWWSNIKNNTNYNDSVVLNSELKKTLESFINDKDSYWIAGEFIDNILIYKGKKNGILDLISIGQTWTNTFHLIELKYKFIVSFRIENETINIKTNGLINTIIKN